MEAKLVLEDGTVFRGRSFGYHGEAVGEVVFNTSMTGYQEVLTDPSYCGHMVAMTYPLMGNYGINPQDFEARQPFLSGFIASRFCRYPSNWRATGTLEQFLKEYNIPALEGVDTRALAVHIRDKGSMRGVLSTAGAADKELVKKALQAPFISEQQLIEKVSIQKPFTLEGNGPHIVLIDLGAKQSIIQSLNKMGCRVTAAPSSFTTREILALQPDGIVFSNGPGDPEKALDIITLGRELLGKLPLLGICLGHQILALAVGAKSYKLKFGHRGSNHPVKNLQTGRIHITTQNHGFAIDEKTLGPELDVTHLHLHDQTVEGLRHRQLPLLTVQHHPEAMPGPEDSRYIFEDFLSMIKPGEVK